MQRELAIPGKFRIRMRNTSHFHPMAYTLAQYLASREEAEVASKAYSSVLALPIVDRAKQAASLLPEGVANRVKTLLEINACPSCHASRSSSDSFCERCGDANEDYFEALGALVEAHPIGRIVPSGRG